MAVGREQYKEFRKDGWPLCPNCGEDELYSLISNWKNGKEIGPEPTLDDYIASGLSCYRCRWLSTETLERLIKSD